jgi:Family of unknown function (DUF6130)
MQILLKELTAMAASFLIVAGAAAQSATDIRGSSPLVAIENEPPPKLIVDPPLAEQLSRGLVFIQYRTENTRIMPVFGKGALEVSPRLGHVHITVDDAPWSLSTPAAKQSSLSACCPVRIRCWSNSPIRHTESSPAKQ